jgi:predicted transcriptional regulator
MPRLSKYHEDIIFRLKVKSRTKNELMDVTGIGNAPITNALKALEGKKIIRREEGRYHIQEN